MRLLSVTTLHGPNVWGNASVLEARVDVSDWQHLGAEDVLAFQQRLHAILPTRTTAKTDLSSGLPGALLAAALCEAALELEARVTTSVSSGGVGRISEAGTLDVAIEYEEARLGRACLDSAQRICLAVLGNKDFQIAVEIGRLRALAEDVCLGRATGPLVAAARARGIPYRRLDDESLVQLGQGSEQRRIRTSITENTGKIAEWISLDKELTKKLLAELGLPVPLGRPVTSAEHAWDTACELGTPVVVKPRNADYGHGISLNLSSREQVVAAYVAARKHGDEVLVERFALGSQYRVTVVGGRMVAAVRREPVRLVGDGQLTVSQLIDRANLDPHRGDDLRLPLDRVCADDDTAQLLAEQGMDFDSVVPAGVEVVLSRIAHSWAGAGVTDVTDLVHPHVAAQCVRAVRLIGLDVAGLDVVAEDIGRPLDDQGGVILEVNAEPTIAFHFPPLCDGYRPVCEAIIDSLFPDGRTGRIPLAVITGRSDRMIVGRWLARLLGETTQVVARSSSDGVYFNDERLRSGDQANLTGSNTALLSPQVGAAVLERDLANIRYEGLGFDQVNVAILCRLAPDPAHGLDSELDRAARVLVASVAPGGTIVIEANDPVAAAITESSACKNVVVVVSDPENPMPRTDFGAECPTVCLSGHNLVIQSPAGSKQIVTLNEFALSAAVGSGQISGLLVAVAAAWSMDVPRSVIETRLNLALGADTV
jgi:cyanophycin synthetase